jgi:hypothetical protein
MPASLSFPPICPFSRIGTVQGDYDEHISRQAAYGVNWFIALREPQAQATGAARIVRIRFDNLAPPARKRLFDLLDGDEISVPLNLGMQGKAVLLPPDALP